VQLAELGGVVDAVRFTASVLCFTLSCLPVQLESRVAAANRAVDTAWLAGAERLAPYDYFRARLHLEKAHEESREGHYADALSLAGAAIRLAMEAERAALNEARRTDKSSQ
jgi:hypothetical protein